jgi:hypothetical protein
MLDLPEKEPEVPYKIRLVDKVKSFPDPEPAIDDPARWVPKANYIQLERLFDVVEPK